MRDRINSAMKQAMRDKEVLRLSTLRLVMAAIKDRDIAARVDGVDNSVSDDEILAILGKMIKQRKDSATAYGNAGRTELAAQELSEIEIITGFLPKQLNDDEIGDVVKKVINDSGASGIRDMGKVMGLLKKNYTGQMDFGKAGGLVKSLLG
ncbi:GatB/YqeY domain-containing protein [Amylibacter sp.]|nr:GatB/YqeY domain-containing protein [Amylibacter sp.]MDB4080971.1 GatB/YqeY domain-containing protein [Amylibacter sp.]